ncbi:MAG: carbohydrate-binding domain-containing protein [Ruminococcaceae bacterium]|nr:carbohydrate-binding domain-containing protein [Oscillospiraceae bacterium]
MKTRIFALLLCLLLLLTGCGKKDKNEGYTNPEEQGTTADLGDDNKSFGESLDDLGAYDGYFEGESTDIVVECVSGTQGAYKLEGTTLTFSTIGEDSVYSISGKLRGNIVVDIGEGHKLDLELCGLSLVCNSTNPITVVSGDEVAIQAKKDTKNYIYDMRSAIDETEETLYSGAIHSDVDLEIGGKGDLTVVSENNNGIHSKDDLQVKNLTLLVACIDNSLKGNDGVEIEGGNTTLIASGGDCIKTSNSDISEKGNQRGSISIVGGTHNLYAACDGIDAAYNATVDDSTTVLNIYTDKYSNYSKEVTATSSDANYIRFTSNAYYYSVKYYNSDTDYVWVNAEYHSSVSGGRSNYYYYSYPKMPEYAKVQFFIYESESQRGQDSEYLVASDYLTQNSAYDTFALTQSYNGLGYQWTNYTTTIQEGGFGGPGGHGGGGMGGPGGMGEGNTDKGEYSTKGIKAANEIVINNGTVNIKSYDDAIHANNDTTLENGATPLGNVTINGGTITAYSNDDGLHADGMLNIKAGTVSVTNSYEGVEGTTVNISGGYVSVNAKDDGINATTTSGVAIAISGGTVYIYCTGDGIDSNSRTSYQGIVFSGGNTVVISNSNGNSAIDSEQGYAYEGGAVIAIMPRGGMSSEATHCQSFSSIGKSTQMSLTKDSYLVAEIGGGTATVKMPASINALVITLGDSSPSITTESSVSVTLDGNGVAWN